MPTFNKPELQNFLRFLRRRMDLAPRYVCQLIYLVMRRLWNRMQRAWTRDVHLGSKQWPAWLDHSELDVTESRHLPLLFAHYDTHPSDVGVCVDRCSSIAASTEDPEQYLAQNRWGECVAALIENHRTSGGISHVVKWIDNAVPKADAAWEPYSASERVVNLAVLLSVHPRLQAEIGEDRVRAFLEESLRWIHSHLEYYGTRNTNNHILNNARALVVGGTLLRCSVAVEHGLVLFARMGGQLFQDAGFLRERSSHYQIIVTNWLFDVVHFSRTPAILSAAGMQAREELEGLAKRVARATSMLLGYLEAAATHIGDLSPDLHPTVSSERLRLLYSSFFDEAPSLPRGQWDDWIFESQGVDSIVLCPLTVYPAGFTTHGHRDLGSFVWLHKGRPLLVDAGRYQYTQDSASRYQVGSSAHNTVLVNGMGPLPESLFTHAQWYPDVYSHVKVSVSIDPSKSVALKHNGFARIRSVGEHIRQVRMEGDGLAIHDQFEGNGTVLIETFWHFPPDFFPEAGNPTCVTAPGIQVSVVGVAAAGHLPAHDWQPYPYSSAYGEQQSAYRLRMMWTLSLPCAIHTELRATVCAA